MNMRSWKSLNFDRRKPDKPPSLIIIHYTGMETEAEALQRLCDPASKVSSHYFINESGEVLNLVDDEMRAWHAGVSQWEKATDINSKSIGIELVNPGHEFGYRPFPEAQIGAMTKLCAQLISRYGMRKCDVLGHSDIAPKRKQDPGELFPWKTLALEGVGVWPQPNEGDQEKARYMLDKTDMIKELLAAYGYNPDTPFDRLIIAFHRHFYPEIFAGSADPAVPDITSCARLLALGRVK